MGSQVKTLLLSVKLWCMMSASFAEELCVCSCADGLFDFDIRVDDCSTCTDLFCTRFADEADGGEGPECVVASCGGSAPSTRTPTLSPASAPTILGTPTLPPATSAPTIAQVTSAPTTDFSFSFSAEEAANRATLSDWAAAAQDVPVDPAMYCAPFAPRATIHTPISTVEVT